MCVSLSLLLMIPCTDQSLLTLHALYKNNINKQINNSHITTNLGACVSVQMFSWKSVTITSSHKTWGGGGEVFEQVQLVCDWEQVCTNCDLEQFCPDSILGKVQHESLLNPNPIGGGGGGAFMAPPCHFFRRASRPIGISRSNFMTFFSQVSRIFWYIIHPGRTCRTDVRGR